MAFFDDLGAAGASYADDCDVNNDFVNGGTPVTANATILTQGTVVVAPYAIAANAVGAVVTRIANHGIRRPKATGEAWAAMQNVYWSAANSNFTTTSTSNTLAGKAAKAAASGDTTGMVLLNF